MKSRLKKVARVLIEKGHDAMLVLRPENMYYLSGFSGSTGALLVARANSYLCVDFRYIEQAQRESPHLEIVLVKETIPAAIAELREKLRFNTLGFETDYINCKLLFNLREKLPGVETLPMDGVIEEQRQVKDRTELAAIAQAMAMLDRGYDYICGHIKPGVSERDISLELEMFMRRRGASGTSFPFIIASGPRSSLPHGEASAKKIRQGDIIMLDFGVVMNHYNSDMSRTIALGKPPPEMRKIYDLVLEAQLAGLNAIKEGVTASAVDKAARSVIEAHGYGDYFGHGTGHGVGLAVHERPRLSPRDDTVLKAGMVVTVEPGIYLPGRGGVRIEDSVVVEKYGCRLLTKAPKNSLVEI
ncbi:MAG: Xaa-Pro peptidase family protein [Firmicutes bacterium]|nr:Xaa-Pro peptidase family protein [Bacillota bacterium]